MKSATLLLIILFLGPTVNVLAQPNKVMSLSDGDRPISDNLPSWLLQSPIKLEVFQYPERVNATWKVNKNDTIYIWKHSTTVMNPISSSITVKEAGAYILQSGEWKLRVQYDRKEFARLFECPGGVLEPREPYVFVKNWRKSPELFRGYALWYFKGFDDEDELHVGYAIVETRDKLIGGQKYIEK